jgi:hypothetical protein
LDALEIHDKRALSRHVLRFISTLKPLSHSPFAMKFSLLATIVASISPLAQAADANAWKSRNIYFALTDRVARSANDNGGSACGNLGNYCGGTFKGLESKLDYIKGMGFDAIWITPVVDSKYREHWSSTVADGLGRY